MTNTKYRKRFTVVFISRVLGIAVESNAKDFHLKSQAEDCLERLKVMFKTTYINGYVRTNGRERRA
jgi:hypothetical protein